ncbi:hypothetical protein AKJ09_08257 [Labilithrix luteola]|uniref:Lipoprotein n=1 Tax=Labilithrix luteola TaxID=1391654 RepID=A0A0K1Q792_9BACT|nr:hypothetical protein [Labilithrix luteola]AKV01594.1 hypothetical protein AKJ09_08257 [Labilithrix luteola]
MRPSPLLGPRTVVALIALATTTGCTATTSLSAARVPTPVLLGPVDRIGGHRAGGERTIAHLSKEVSDLVTVSETKSRHGNFVVIKREYSQLSTGSGEVSREILTLTKGQADRDVRVDALPAGTYVMIFGGFATSNVWVGVEGDVVEVNHARR